VVTANMDLGHGAVPTLAPNRNAAGRDPAHGVADPNEREHCDRQAHPHGQGSGHFVALRARQSAGCRATAQHEKPRRTQGEQNKNEGAADEISHGEWLCWLLSLLCSMAFQPTQ
jgi:hypothetical protein